MEILLIWSKAQCSITFLVLCALVGIYCIMYTCMISSWALSIDTMPSWVEYWKTVAHSTKIGIKKVNIYTHPYIRCQREKMESLWKYPIPYERLGCHWHTLPCLSMWFYYVLVGTILLLRLFIRIHLFTSSNIKCIGFGSHNVHMMKFHLFMSYVLFQRTRFLSMIFFRRVTVVCCRDYE